MTGTLSLETLQDSHIVEEIAQQLVQGIDVMRVKHTTKLWLKDIEMVEILLSFIKSDMKLAAAFENGSSDVAFPGCGGPQQIRKIPTPVSIDHAAPAGDTPGGLHAF